MREINENDKNPKRVSAGKKGAEAKKIKNELKRKEMDKIKKENMELKSITKDDEPSKINVYKNYIPLCLVGIVGIGVYLYMHAPKQVKIKEDIKPKKKEIDRHKAGRNDDFDPFELR
jgi:hypothetical protein